MAEDETKKIEGAEEFVAPETGEEKEETQIDQENNSIEETEKTAGDFEMCFYRAINSFGKKTENVTTPEERRRRKDETRYLVEGKTSENARDYPKMLAKKIKEAGFDFTKSTINLDEVIQVEVGGRIYRIACSEIGYNDMEFSISYYEPHYEDKKRKTK